MGGCACEGGGIFSLRACCTGARKRSPLIALVEYESTSYFLAGPRWKTSRFRTRSRGCVESITKYSYEWCSSTGWLVRPSDLSWAYSDPPTFIMLLFAWCSFAQVDPGVREVMGINLKDAVVIFDEVGGVELPPSTQRPCSFPSSLPSFLVPLAPFGGTRLFFRCHCCFVLCRPSPSKAIIESMPST